MKLLIIMAAPFLMDAADPGNGDTGGRDIVHDVDSAGSIRAIFDDEYNCGDGNHEATFVQKKAQYQSSHRTLDHEHKLDSQFLSTTKLSALCPTVPDYSPIDHNCAKSQLFYIKNYSWKPCTEPPPTTGFDAILEQALEQMRQFCEEAATKLGGNRYRMKIRTACQGIKKENLNALFEVIGTAISWTPHGAIAVHGATMFVDWFKERYSPSLIKANKWTEDILRTEDYEDYCLYVEGDAGGTIEAFNKDTKTITVNGESRGNAHVTYCAVSASKDYALKNTQDTLFFAELAFSVFMTAIITVISNQGSLLKATIPILGSMADGGIEIFVDTLDAAAELMGVVLVLEQFRVGEAQTHPTDLANAAEKRANANSKQVKSKLLACMVEMNDEIQDELKNLDVKVTKLIKDMAAVQEDVEKIWQHLKTTEQHLRLSAMMRTLASVTSEYDLVHANTLFAVEKGYLPEWEVIDPMLDKYVVMAATMNGLASDTIHTETFSAALGIMKLATRAFIAISTFVSKRSKLDFDKAMRKTDARCESMFVTKDSSFKSPRIYHADLPVTDALCEQLIPREHLLSTTTTEIRTVYERILVQYLRTELDRTYFDEPPSVVYKTVLFDDVTERAVWNTGCGDEFEAVTSAAQCENWGSENPNKWFQRVRWGTSKSGSLVCKISSILSSKILILCKKKALYSNLGGADAWEEANGTKSPSTCIGESKSLEEEEGKELHLTDLEKFCRRLCDSRDWCFGYAYRDFRTLFNVIDIWDNLLGLECKLLRGECDIPDDTGDILDEWKQYDLLFTRKPPTPNAAAVLHVDSSGSQHPLGITLVPHAYPISETKDQAFWYDIHLTYYDYRGKRTPTKLFRVMNKHEKVTLDMTGTVEDQARIYNQRCLSDDPPCYPDHYVVDHSVIDPCVKTSHPDACYDTIEAAKSGIKAEINVGPLFDEGVAKPGGVPTSMSMLYLGLYRELWLEGTQSMNEAYLEFLTGTSPLSISDYTCASVVMDEDAVSSLQHAAGYDKTIFALVSNKAMGTCCQLKNATGVLIPDAASSRCGVRELEEASPPHNWGVSCDETGGGGKGICMGENDCGCDVSSTSSAAGDGCTSGGVCGDNLVCCHKCQTTSTCEARCSNPDTQSGAPASRERYATASVTYPEQCLAESQSRTCDNGRWNQWSGSSNTFETCTQLTPSPTPSPTPPPTPSPTPCPPTPPPTPASPLSNYIKTDASETIENICPETNKEVYDIKDVTVCASKCDSHPTCKQFQFCTLGAPKCCRLSSTCTLPYTKATKHWDSYMKKRQAVWAPIIYQRDGKCLGVNQYGDLYVYTCNGDDSQKWRFSGGALLNHDGRCVFVQGTYPKLRTCDGSNLQQFSVTAEDNIKNIKSNCLCLKEMIVGDIRMNVLSCTGVNEVWATQDNCVDTAGWNNGHSNDCVQYSAQGWCENGAAKTDYDWTLGATYGYPENNCCVCGKLT